MSLLFFRETLETLETLCTLFALFSVRTFTFILICIQKATTSFDIVAYKRICEFSAKVGLFSLLFHFLRIVERQFLRRVGKVHRSFIRNYRIAQLLF